MQYNTSFIITTHEKSEWIPREREREDIIHISHSREYYDLFKLLVKSVFFYTILYKKLECYIVLAAEAGRACMQQELLLFLLLPLLLLLLLCSIWLTERERERVLKEKHKFLVKGKWASRVPHITFMAGIFIFIFHICIFAIWHKSLPLWLIRPLCSDTSTTRNCFCCCCSYITFIMRLSLPFSIAFSLSLAHSPSLLTTHSSRLSLPV